MVFYENKTQQVQVTDGSLNPIYVVDGHLLVQPSRYFVDLTVSGYYGVSDVSGYKYIPTPIETPILSSNITITGTIFTTNSTPSHSSYDDEVIDIIASEQISTEPAVIGSFIVPYTSSVPLPVVEGGPENYIHSGSFYANVNVNLQSLTFRWYHPAVRPTTINIRITYYSSTNM